MGNTQYTRIAHPPDNSAHNLTQPGYCAVDRLVWRTRHMLRREDLPCSAKSLTSLEMENRNIYTPFGNPLETENINIYIYYSHLNVQ
eukprot:COSAG02_NODE_48804_length_331_cov_0.836207_1_plen_87_part_00